MFYDCPPASIFCPPQNHNLLREDQNLAIVSDNWRRNGEFPRKLIPAKAGIYSNMGGIAALVTPPLAAHDCEIPAYAGMVCLGNGELWANSANCGTRHCEIPAYAGMVCLGNGELWANSANCGTRHCEIPAFAGMVCLGNGELWANPPNCGTRHCEIPAFAGMVYLETPNYRRPAANCPPLPTIVRQIRPHTPVRRQKTMPKSAHKLPSATTIRQNLAV